MDNFVLFILKANIALLVLFLIYWFLFKNESFHSFNRVYLISITFCALIIPGLPFQIPDFYSDSSIQTITLEQLLSEQQLFFAQPSVSDTFSSDLYFKNTTPAILFSFIYISGALIMLCMSTFRLLQLRKLLRDNNHDTYKDVKIVSPQQDFSPFSFFNYIIINRNKFTDSDFRQIVSHERIHYRQGHTLDLLLFELMRIIFWINPVIYIMSNCIRATHEFLADLGVINQGYDKQNYQLLILKQISTIPFPSISNTFTFSQVKRRISMLNIKRSSTYSKMKTLIIFPVLLMLFGFLNFPSEAIDVPIISGAESQFDLPLNKGNVTQKFGMGINPFTKKEVFHRGIDIAAAQGTTIFAAEDGIILLADSLKGHGNKIIIQHDNGFATHYSHLYKLLVSEQDNVSKGSVIGLVGSTGLSTAPHLHFEIRKDGESVNPSEYLDLTSYNKK